MEPVRRRLDQCRVVGLEALDYRRHIGTHGGVLPEQLVVEPSLEDAALGRIEVGDVLLPALKRMDEVLDLRCSTSGDKLLGLGPKGVARGYEVRPEVGLVGIVLIPNGYDVGRRCSGPSGNAVMGCHVRKVGVARNDVGN